MKKVVIKSNKKYRVDIPTTDESTKLKWIQIYILWKTVKIDKIMGLYW